MGVKVKVLRRLIGDKTYEVGATRVMDKADAERLASTGAVKIMAQPKPAKGK